MKAVQLAIAISLIAGAANAADIYAEQGNAADSWIYRQISLPGAGAYNIEITSSGLAQLDLSGFYRYHWDIFLAPPPRPHSENLEGNSNNTYQETSINSTRIYMRFVVPETTYSFYDAGSQYQYRGIDPGTPLYREVKYENPRVDMYLRTLTEGPVDYSFSVSSAPEPATWALMILGFGVAGAQLRMRRNPCNRQTT